MWPLSLLTLADATRSLLTALMKSPYGMALRLVPLARLGSTRTASTSPTAISASHRQLGFVLCGPPGLPDRPGRGSGGLLAISSMVGVGCDNQTRGGVPRQPWR